jgi:hypothetical protein
LRAADGTDVRDRVGELEIDHFCAEILDGDRRLRHPQDMRAAEEHFVE